MPPTTHYLMKQVSCQFQISFLREESNLCAVGVEEAISDLPVLSPGEGSEEQNYTQEGRTDYQKWARGKQKVLYNHVAMKHTVRDENYLSQYNQIGNAVPPLLAKAIADHIRSTLGKATDK